MHQPSEVTSPLPSPSLSLASRERRLADLVLVIGAPEPRFHARGLLQALNDEVSRNWALHVVPLIETHWPELLEMPFYGKLRISTVEFLCHAPYLGIALSARRSSLLRALLAVCQSLRLGETSIAWLLKVTFAPLARHTLRRESRDIVLGGALIFLLDEVLDRRLAGLRPDLRGKVLARALEGTSVPSDGPLALVNALGRSLEADSNVADRRQLRTILHRCWSWTAAEAAYHRPAKESEWQNLREVGLRTAADGLAWTVRPHADAALRDWFLDVTRLVQMLDDLVDLGADLAAGVRTPVVTGAWTVETAERAFGETTSALRALAMGNGITYGPFLSLLGEIFVQQVRLLLDLMVSGAVD